MFKRDFKARILRIWKKNEDSTFAFCGMGFYIKEGYLLTCAHVVKNEKTKFLVDFPLDNKEKKKIPVSILLQLDDPDEDIAILKMDNISFEISIIQQNTIFKSSHDYWGHSFQVFGCSNNTLSGDWVHGKLRGLDARGWLQAQRESVTSLSVRRGYSGSPVWDDEINGIIGIVVERYENIDIESSYYDSNTFFVIPNHKIEELLSKNNISNVFKSFHFTQNESSILRFYTPLVKRSQKESEIIEDLFKINQEKSNKNIVLLKGAGGYGKTELAKSIKDNSQVMRLFEDGIYFIEFATSKQNSKEYFIDKLQEVIKLVSGDINFSSINTGEGISKLSALSSKISTLLYHANVLIIYDNLLNFSFAPYFLPKRTKSTYIITSRELPPFEQGLIIHEIGQTKWNESASILSYGLDIANVSKIKILADKLGHMPQLLALVNSYLNFKVNHLNKRADEALEFIDAALIRKGITYFDNQDSISNSKAISLVIDLSLEQLTTDEISNLRKLSIFSLGADIPFEIIETLWECDIFDVEYLCEKFYKISLVKKINLAENTINIHDVIHQYLIKLLGNEKNEIIRTLLRKKPVDFSGKIVLEKGTKYLLNHYGYFMLNGNRKSELIKIYSNANFLSQWILSSGINNILQDLSYVVTRLKKDKAIFNIYRLLTKHGYLFEKCSNQTEVLNIIVYLFLSKKLLADNIQKFKLGNKLTFYPLKPIPSSYSYPEIFNLTGHFDEIVCCSLSKGGQYFVTASNEGIIKVWESATGRNLYTIDGHEDRVTNCVVTINDEFISCSEDCTIKLWDLESGNLIKMFSHESSINFFDINLEKNILASACGDHLIMIWDLEDNSSNLYSLSKHKSEVTCCKLSPDGNYLVSSASDSEIILWENKDGKYTYKKSLNGHKESISHCCFLNSNYIISSSLDSTIRIWNISTGKNSLTFQSDSPINTINITSDKEYVFSGNQNGEIEIWNILKKQRMARFRAHVQMINCLALSEDDRILYSVSEDRKIKTWNLSDIKAFNSISNNRQNIQSVAKSWDEKYIAISESHNNIIKIYTGSSYSEESLLNGHDKAVLCCDFSPQVSQLISSGTDKKIILWDYINRRKLDEVINAHKQYIHTCAISQNNIITGCYDGIVKVWKIDNNKIVPNYSFNLSSSVTACGFNDSANLYIVSSFNRIEIRDTISGNIMYELSKLSAIVNAVTIDSKSNLVVICFLDGSIATWDYKKNHVEHLTKLEKGAVGCSFCNGTDFMITVSLDQNVILWNKYTKEKITILRLDNSLTCCDWKFGKTIAVGSVSGVYLFRVNEVNDKLGQNTY